MTSSEVKSLALSLADGSENKIVSTLMEFADLKGRIEERRNAARRQIDSVATTRAMRFCLQNEIHMLNIMEFGMDRACAMEEEERERERKAEEAWRRGEQAPKSDKK